MKKALVTIVLVMGLTAPAVACEYEDGRYVIQTVRRKDPGIRPIIVGGDYFLSKVKKITFHTSQHGVVNGVMVHLENDDKVIHPWHEIEFLWCRPQEQD